MKFRAICSGLRNAGHTLHQLAAGNGVVIVSQTGARIYALAFAEDEENLFWTPNELTEHGFDGERDAVINGGDYLRFAPEFAFAWTSRPYDVEQLSNYRVQRAELPGSYSLMAQRPDELGFAMQSELTDWRDGQTVRFEVERHIAPAPSPLPVADVQYAGYQTQHRLRVREAAPGRVIGLWHLLQMPVQSTLIVPLKTNEEPLSYFKPGGWTMHEDHLRWTFEGKDSAKIGLSREQVTGRSGIMRRLKDNRWTLLVRQFPVYPGLTYADGPSEAEAGDQVVQAWDGLGFGEMEYHSPAVGLHDALPSVYHETSLLWAFGGAAAAITDVARQLLEVDVRAVIRDGAAPSRS